MTFTVSTDEIGFRRLPDVPRPEKNVLFLGDSCTFGVGVEDDETFAALLQRRLPGVRCLNGGVPGYTAFQGRLLLEEEPLPTPLDVVVIAFLFNDDSRWDDLSDVEHARSLQSLGARLTRQSRLALFLSQITLALSRDEASRPNRPRLTDGEYSAELLEIGKHTRKQGARPILVVWPFRSQMTRLSHTVKQDIVQYVAQEHGVPLVDLVPPFRASGGEELFADVVHANARGHQLVADQLEPILRRELGGSYLDWDPRRDPH